MQDRLNEALHGLHGEERRQEAIAVLVALSVQRILDSVRVAGKNGVRTDACGRRVITIRR